MNEFYVMKVEQKHSKAKNTDYYVAVLYDYNNCVTIQNVFVSKAFYETYVGQTYVEVEKSDFKFAPVLVDKNILYQLQYVGG